MLQYNHQEMRETLNYGHTLYVGSSSKIQTLCHMTQVLLKLRFTMMERLAGVAFLHLHMCRYITN